MPEENQQTRMARLNKGRLSVQGKAPRQTSEDKPEVFTCPICNKEIGEKEKVCHIPKGTVMIPAHEECQDKATAANREKLEGKGKKFLG